MSLEGLLRTVTESLTAVSIPFMLAGSVAAAVHGAARATMDIDLVIDPDSETLAAFVARIDAAGLYVSADAASEALATRTMFNVVDPETGWKADLIVRRNRAFSETEFARREAVDVAGVPISVATLEDVILSKLEWARLGGSARQIEDVQGLLRVSGDALDVAYLGRWIDDLDVRMEWERARSG